MAADCTSLVGCGFASCDDNCLHVIGFVNPVAELRVRPACFADFIADFFGVLRRMRCGRKERRGRAEFWP